MSIIILSFLIHTSKSVSGKCIVNASVYVIFKNIRAELFFLLHNLKDVKNKKYLES